MVALRKRRHEPGRDLLIQEYGKLMHGEPIRSR
jgi:hypothetical protein